MVLRRTLVPLLVAFAVPACAAPAHDGDGAQDESADALSVDLRVDIDVSKRSHRIPEKFVGLSLSRDDYVSGYHNLALFDPAKNPHYDQLVNLFREIGIKHVRLVEGNGCDKPTPTGEEDDKFFAFARQAGLPDHSVIYPLRIQDYAAAGCGTKRSGGHAQHDVSDVRNAARLWATHAPMIESLALDNEPDYHFHDGDPHITGPCSFVDAWTDRYRAMQAAINGPSIPFSGPDTGSEYPARTGGIENPTDCHGNKTPAFTLFFARAEKERIDLATQHFYGDSTDDLPAGQHSPLSASELANGMLGPRMHDMYSKLHEGALAGAPDWPSGLRYRFTEANAYSVGTDPANQLFALALWSLDFFHWWAARGAVGVDPFTYLSNYNAPIFVDEHGSFVAEPYAYGMLAFAQGSSGTTIDADAVHVPASTSDWLSVYPVVGDHGELYVTIVNKTFKEIGAKSAHLSLKAAGMPAKHARRLVLSAVRGKSGDATSKSATLGGDTIPSTGHWNGTWDPVAVDRDGTVDVTVPAASAVVLEVK